MSERQPHRHVPEEHRAQEHLANERTFLSWVRTSIALLSLGFVLARIAPTLAEHATGDKAHIGTRALPVGVGLVLLGATLILFAAWRYDQVNCEIESGMVKTDRALVWFVSVAIVLISVAIIVYLIISTY